MAPSKKRRIVKAEEERGAEGEGGVEALVKKTGKKKERSGIRKIKEEEEAGASVEGTEKGGGSVNGGAVYMKNRPTTRKGKKVNYTECPDEDDGEVSGKKRRRKRKRRNLLDEKGSGENCGAQESVRVEQSNVFEPEEGIISDGCKEKTVGRPKKKGKKDVGTENGTKTNGAEMKDPPGRTTRTGRPSRAVQVRNQDTAKINKHDPQVTIFFPVSLLLCCLLLVLVAVLCSTDFGFDSGLNRSP